MRRSSTAACTTLVLFALFGLALADAVTQLERSTDERVTAERVTPRVAVQPNKFFVLDKLHRIIHTKVKHPGVVAISGYADGKIVHVGGAAAYWLKFNGTHTKHKTIAAVTDARFKLRVIGKINKLYYRLKHTTKAQGKVLGSAHNFKILGKYVTKLDGTTHGKKTLGTVAATFVVKFESGKLYVKEQGTFDLVAGGKRVWGKWLAVLEDGKLSIDTGGKIGAEKFYLKSGSTFKLFLHAFAGVHSVKQFVKRNYGSYALTVRGHFEHKGMIAMPKY